MRACVVTLLLAASLTVPVTARAADRLPLEDINSAESKATRDRCLGAGAAGAGAGVLGMVLGGGVALGISEIIKVSDPANTSSSKQFGSFAIPFGVIAGGIAGLAVGTIGAWELGEELAGKPSVTR